MADEYAVLKQMLQQQRQLKLMEALTVKLSKAPMGQSNAAGGSHSVDHIADSITEFSYDPVALITFDSWYKRYEDLSSVDLAAQDDAWKSIRSHRPNRILLRGPSKCPRRDLRHLLVGTVARGISTGMALSASIAAKTVIRWDTVTGSANQDQLMEASQPQSLLISNTVSGQKSAYGWTLSQTSPLSLRDSGSPLAVQRCSKTSQLATSAYGGLVKLMGQLQCCVSFRVTNISANCYVTKSDLNLLGLDWIERLGLDNMPLRVVCSQVQIPAVLADQAKILRLDCGSMLFDVGVGDNIWVRHHNQIQQRHCSNRTGLESVPSLPLDVLLDTLAIPADRSVLEPTAASPSDVPPEASVTASVSPDNKPRLRRRTDRVRRSTLLMQVNPRKRRY
ncbi:hypothetical protein SprV_0401722400 [Sparganum proliferum]